MINPNKKYGRRMTKAEAIDHKIYDPNNMLFKYAFNEELIIYTQWSIVLDEPVIRGVRRAPKKSKPTTFFGRDLKPIDGGIDWNGMRRTV